MTTPGAPRLDWIDSVRGIAVLLVVMYHSIIAIPAAATDTVILDRINDALSPLRMPILMLLSGLLLSRSLAKSRGDYIRGKLRAIGWPYLVWTTITLGFLYVGSKTAGEGNFTVRRVLESIVDPRTYTWYLAYLLGFYLLALVIPARYRLILIPVLLIVCGIVNDDEGWSRLTYLLAFFFMGDWAMRHRDRWVIISRPAVVAVSAVLSAATIGLSGFDVPTRYTVWSVFGILGAVVCLIAGSGWLLQHIPITATVGRDSIVYYVTHWPVVTATAHLLVKVGITNGFLATVVMICAGLGVSAAMVWLRHRSRVAAALYAFRPDDRRSNSPDPLTAALSSVPGRTARLRRAVRWYGQASSRCSPPAIRHSPALGLADRRRSAHPAGIGRPQAQIGSLVHPELRQPILDVSEATGAV